MADTIINANRHTLGYYLSLPAANDGLVLIPFEATGIPTDATFEDADTLAAIVAAGAVEQTTMGRKTVAATTVTVDDVSDSTSIDTADVEWTAPGGNSTAKLLVCYDPDTTTGTDAGLLPLVAYDFAAIPDGATDITARVNTSGLAGFA